ncbi:hypothetical protein [Ottowia caeni]|uniref:hypothetical protein n=1 Tax=Ottowia caeni TaxID=2870339 RepID=UPI003D75BF73
MRGLLRFVFSPWLIVGSALSMLSVLVWWVGPLLRIGAFSPLEKPGVRAAVIALLVVVVIGRYVWRHWRARKASQRLTEGLVKPVESKAAPTTPGEQKSWASASQRPFKP